MMAHMCVAIREPLRLTHGDISPTCWLLLAVTFLREQCCCCCSVAAMATQLAGLNLYRS
jgi:hypothetical protein